MSLQRRFPYGNARRYFYLAATNPDDLMSFGANILTVGSGGTYGTLTEALAVATSGKVVMLLPGSYTMPDTATSFDVPDGVSLLSAAGPEVTTVNGTGTPTVPTIVFRGNNWVEGINFVSVSSSLGTEGGIRLCGSNHTFVNCWIEGNQDTLTVGDIAFTPNSTSLGLIDGGTWTAATNTLTKTGNFANYTWKSGDAITITAGGTAGIYTIASRVSSDAITLSSSISGGDLAGTVTGCVAAQHHQWGGGTEFRNCRINWTFDFLRINGCLGCTRSVSSPAINVAGIGVQDMNFYGCKFTGTSGSKFIIDWLLQCTIQGCDFNTPSASWVVAGGQGAPQNPSGYYYKPTIAVTGASSDGAGTTITATGAFTSYHWRDGDTFIVASGTGATVGTYQITSRTSDDVIVVNPSIGASATDVVATIVPVFKLRVIDTSILMGTIQVGSGIVRVSTTTTPAAGSCGPKVEFDGVVLKTFNTPTVLFRGGNYANPSPKAEFHIRNCTLPWSSGTYYTAVGQTPAAASNPPIYFYGSTQWVGATTANGSTSSDPADVWFPTSVVAGADATKGVRLTMPIGETQTLRNNSASALKVYPVSGGDIDGAGADVAYSLSANTTKTFHRTTSTVFWSQ